MCGTGQERQAPMRDGFRIFDIDRHVHEPLNLWPDYLERRFAAYAPTLTYLDRGEALSDRMSAGVAGALLPLPPDLIVDGEPVMNISRSAKIQTARAAMARRDTLAEGGRRQASSRRWTATVWTSRCSCPPTPPISCYLVTMDHREPGLAAGFAAAYNR